MDSGNSLLPLDDYRRYGRQMILDGFGLQGQLKLQSASVIVVGSGGLGCPALQYLAAAGVGKIGIIDHDIVEVSNLQRQILHNEQTVGMHKTESAAQAIQRLNSRIQVECINEALSPHNAASHLKDYDIILDCTDNPSTRYLISDTAVSLGKPLVSGAAAEYDGHLCTYNLGENGLCYRCLWPNFPSRPPPTCSETGILGVVTGIIGTLQALEAIKIITGLHDQEPRLLTFSVRRPIMFESIKVRSRKPICPACGTEGEKIGEIQEVDYVQLCGGPTPDWEREGLVGADSEVRIQAKAFKRVLDEQEQLNIIDVRSRTEFGICQIPRSLNVPLRELLADPAKYLPDNDTTETYILCRLGNDSRIAAQTLRGLHQNQTSGTGRRIIIKDVVGGLKAWAKEVDPNFPIY